MNRRRHAIQPQYAATRRATLISLIRFVRRTIVINCYVPITDQQQPTSNMCLPGRHVENVNRRSAPDNHTMSFVQWSLHYFLRGDVIRVGVIGVMLTATLCGERSGHFSNFLIWPLRRQVARHRRLVPVFAMAKRTGDHQT